MSTQIYPHRHCHFILIVIAALSSSSLRAKRSNLIRKQKSYNIIINHQYSCVYILTNSHNKVLYTGVTSNLVKRIWDHKHKTHFGFTSKYNVNKLVYYEFFEDIVNAIIREKQIKGGSRQDKVNLINKFNPEWKDMYGNII